MPNLLSVLGAGAQGFRQGQDRARTAAQAAQLFRSIGSAEGAAFADLLTQNPRGAADVVEAFGGWNQLYTNLTNNALNAQRVGLEQQRVEQGTRGLELEEKAIEQRGKLGERELELREESLDIDRAALGIRRFSALSKIGDLGALEEQLSALPPGPSRDAALSILATGKKPTDALIAGAFKEATGLGDRDFERNVSNDFASAVKEPRNEAKMASRALKLLEGDGQPNAVNDIAVMYGFIKAIDSGSVVRSEEIRLFREALSKWEQGEIALGKLFSPELMTPRVRGQLGTAIKALRADAFRIVDSIESDHLDRARTLHIPEDRARSLMIGRLSKTEREALGSWTPAESEAPAFDPAKASDDEIAAEIRRRSGGR